MMIRAIFLRAVLLLGLWWALTDGAPDTWLVGGITLAAAVVISLQLQPPGNYRLSISGLLSFVVFFLAQSIKGGTQVAAMALRPRLDLHPDVLEIRLRLPHEAEQVVLASLLNLLPGTLSAGLEKNRLQLHVLDSRLPIEEKVRIAEERVARLFGIALP